MTASLLLLLLAGAPTPALAAPTGSAPTPSKPGDDADTLFRKGSAALMADKKEQAYELFLAAWKLKHTHDIAGNLAQVELALGKRRDAAEHIAFALRHFPPSVTAQQDRRDKMKQVLDGLLKEIGVMHLRVSVDGADVFVDGVLVGKAPLEDDVFVEAGTHRIEAKLAGFVTDAQTVEAPKGRAVDVSLVLREVAPEVPPAPPAPAKRSILPGVVLGSLAGAAALTGVGLLAASRVTGAGADDLHDSIVKAGHDCTAGKPTYDARCGDLKDKAGSANTLQTAEVGMFIGAGVAAAAAGTYLLWPQPRTAAGASARVVPVVSTGGGGLLFTGTF